MPSLNILRYFLEAEDGENDASQRKRKKVHFILADYNATVLALVTLPGLLITWYNTCQNPDKHHPASELQIDTALLDSFRHDLSQRGISLTFIAGAWSPRFVDLISPSESSSTYQPSRTLILASETIYAPKSLRPFAETLVALLRRRRRQPIPRSSQRLEPIALIAAKEMYFGVGGGVKDFLQVLDEVAGGEVCSRRVYSSCMAGVVREVLQVTVNEMEA